MANKRLAASAAGVALAIGLGLSASANAALSFQSCVGSNYNISGVVSPSISCTMLLPLDPTPEVNDSSTLVNETPGFFNFMDWQSDGKWDGLGTSTGGTDTSSYFNFVGDTGGSNTGGTFTRTSTPNNLLNFMFVLKDGQGTNLVGYLLNATTTSGSYGNPFTDPPFDLPGNSTAHAISHISVYYRTGTTSNGGGGGGSVPEPGTLSLIGLAMLGGIFYNRRRKLVR